MLRSMGSLEERATTLIPPATLSARSAKDLHYYSYDAVGGCSPYDRTCEEREEAVRAYREDAPEPPKRSRRRLRKAAHERVTFESE